MAVRLDMRAGQSAEVPMNSPVGEPAAVAEADRLVGVVAVASAAPVGEALSGNVMLGAVVGHADIVAAVAVVVAAVREADRPEWVVAVAFVVAVGEALSGAQALWSKAGCYISRNTLFRSLEQMARRMDSGKMNKAR